MTQKIKKISLLCVALLVVSCIFPILTHAEINVVASLDKRTVDVNDEIKFTIRIYGYSGNIQAPKMPAMEAFDTYYNGRSSSFKFANGVPEHIVELKYVLVPKQTGTFTLPPIDIPVSTTVHRTDPMEITVISLTGATTRTKSFRQQHVPDTSNIPFSNQTPQSATQTQPYQEPRSEPTENDRDLYMQMTADKRSVYPNEQVTVTFTIFTHLNVELGQFEAPDAGGFWIEELPDKKDLVRENIYLYGRNYVKAEVYKMALFPTREGDYTIGPGIMHVAVKQTRRSDKLQDEFFEDNFFGKSILTKKEPRAIKSNSLDITVKPFPAEEKPDDFTGMSGDFRMRADTDLRSVKVNEPITMLISIEGRGNINTIDMPRVQETNAFTMYQSDATAQIDKEHGIISGTKDFEVMFIPQQAGMHSIPEVRFSYYNLKYDRYITLSKGPFPISVKPGSTIPQVVADNEKDIIGVEGKDIQYIFTDLKHKTRNIRMLTSFLIGLNILTIIALIIALIIRRRQEELDKDLTLKRKKLAFGDLKRRLQKLKKYEHAQDVTFFELAPRIMDEYFADKFDCAAQGLTRDIIIEKLSQRGIEQELIKECDEFYESCNFVRFASSSVTEEEFRKISGLLMHLAEAMEKKL